MKFLAWRSKSWARTALVVLTVLATILLASHPELRLLLPVLDGLGLDLLVLLAGAQLLALARPVLHPAWEHVVKPLTRTTYRSFIYLLGFVGPYLDGALAVRFAGDGAGPSTG